MKLLVLLLLLVNVLLFTWQRGLLGTSTEGREPERVARQIAPEKLRVLSPQEAKAVREQARAAAATAAVVSTVADAQGCSELGDFTGEAAARAQARLAALNLADRLETRRIDGVPLYVVHTPPQKTRADAERLAAELRKRGATDATVLGDDSPLKLTVALGAFREADGAKRYVGELEQRGIKGARVADKPIPQPMTRYQIRGVDAALAERLQAIQKELPASRLGPCGSLDAAPRGP